MPCLSLNDGACSATVSTRGGALWSFDILYHGQRIALLAPQGQKEADGAGLSGCFPLVPFGNRLRNNAFTFEGKNHFLSPNTDADPLYLHGDGWLKEWSVDEQEDHRVSISLDMGRNEETSYRYHAYQEFLIRDDALHLTLGVTNLGDDPLPYGLGWHPFFPLTPKTRLYAPASSYWLEGARHLPTRLEPLAPDLDFNGHTLVPDRWINNGFEGWNGRAEILWPERGLALNIEASDNCERYVIYHPGPSSGAEHQKAFFCFEPMTHAIDAHHYPDGGGLVRLSPGETLQGRLVLSPHAVNL